MLSDQQSTVKYQARAEFLPSGPYADSLLYEQELGILSFGVKQPRA
jgi:hypothetical protein